jgi:transcriptional regulator with XRE-family HTH domain
VATIGERVRHWRQRRALSQTELVKLSGVSKKTLQDIETGSVARPHPRTIRRLAQALGIDPWQLSEPGPPVPPSK